MKSQTRFERWAALVAGIAAIATSSARPAEAAYVNEVLADNPLVYYQFSETTGTVIADSSGNGFHGTYTGDQTQLNTATGALGTGSALNFTNNAPLNYVAVPSLGATQTQFTMEFVFNASQMVSIDSIYTTNAFPTGAVHLIFANTNRIQFTLNNASTNDDLLFNNAASLLSVDTPTHIAITADLVNNLISLYVNGVFKQSRSFNLTPDTAAKFDLAGRLGTWSGATSRAMNGMLDEFAIYSGLLSPTRIAVHAESAFADPSVPTPASLPAGLGMLTLVGARRRRRR